MAEDPEYEVEEVVDRGLYPYKKGVRCVWYLLKFKGYPDTDNRWIPAQLTKCKALVREFNEKRKKVNNALTPPQSDSDGIVELFDDVGGGVADRREGLGVDGGVNGGGMDGSMEDGGGVGDEIDGLGVDGGVNGGGMDGSMEDGGVGDEIDGLGVDGGVNGGGMDGSMEDGGVFGGLGGLGENVCVGEEEKQSDVTQKKKKQTKKKN